MFCCVDIGDEHEDDQYKLNRENNANHTNSASDDEGADHYSNDDKV